MCVCTCVCTCVYMCVHVRVHVCLCTDIETGTIGFVYFKYLHKLHEKRSPAEPRSGG